jgi:hypothetical protein
VAKRPATGPRLEAKRLAWAKSVKLVAAIFPPVALFDEVADADDFEALVALLARTDPLLNERLQPALDIPATERVYGPGAGYVMAPFAHPSVEGTRFCPPCLDAPSFGAYYAARDEATSIAEVTHHRTSFLRATAAPAQDLDFDVLNAPIKGAHFYDLRDRRKDFAEVYSPTDYSHSQRLGAELRAKGADGIAFDSVRREGGECVAVFRPRCVGPCRPVKKLVFRWDGEAIAAVLEVKPVRPKVS